MTHYKRVLVKLSGAAVAGASGFGFDNASLSHIVDEVLSLVSAGLQVAIVIGGGNIMRGHTAAYWGIERVEADQIGMLGTIINSLLLRGALTSRLNGATQVRVMTSIPIAAVAEPYIRLRAVSHLKKGHVVIFAGGNGQPFVTTDYPSVQRAAETSCEAILVAKNGTDGVYDRDPNQHVDARRFDTLTYAEAMARDLRVMDPSAIILAREHGLPIHVFDITQTGAMTTICQGEVVGTYIGLQ